MSSGPDTKKRKSGAETPTLARDLLPKPTTSNGPQMPTMTSSPAPTSQKKRGRPSKADVERKQREAIERGDIIPPASVASSPAGLQGQDDRPGATPVMILPAPSTRNPQSVVTPGHMLSPQMGVEHPPTPTMSGEAPGKKRKPRPTPKPKVCSLFNMLRVMLTIRRCRSQVNTNFQSIHQWANQVKEKIRSPQFPQRLHRLVPWLIL
jgi:hypothetical protein